MNVKPESQDGTGQDRHTDMQHAQGMRILDRETRRNEMGNVKQKKRSRGRGRDEE